MIPNNDGGFHMYRKSTTNLATARNAAKRFHGRLVEYPSTLLEDFTVEAKPEPRVTPKEYWAARNAAQIFLI